MEHMKPWTQVVKFMTHTINPKGSVLDNEPRTEQELRKYPEQDNNQGLEHGSRSKF